MLPVLGIYIRYEKKSTDKGVYILYQTLGNSNLCLFCRWLLPLGTEKEAFICLVLVCESLASSAPPPLPVFLGILVTLI